MITARTPTLDDFLRCARGLPPDDCDLYREMTGLNFAPDAVAAQMYLAGGQRWAFCNKYGVAVAVGGYTPAGNGTWRSWFMATGEAWEPHGRGITEAVRKVVAGMFADPYVRRLETATLATRTNARAWYGHIGLTYESTACKSSASGQDIVTYVALKV